MKNSVMNFRNILIVSAFSTVFSVVLSGCSATATEEKVTQPVSEEILRSNSHLIVFIDKTMSNIISDQVIERQTLQLDGLIQENLKNSGDSFFAYTIHSSTGPGSGFQQTVLNIKDLTATGGERTKMNNERQRQNQVQKAVIDCSENCKAELNSQNSQRTNLQTDLWATLNLIGKHTAKLTQHDKVTVLYLSDMIESMNTKNSMRRDFHKNPIATPAEAKKLASQDIKIIRENYLTELPAYPGNITVKIWLPYGSHTPQNTASMLAYWEEVFRLLDIKTEPANS